jgi:acyl carrier protein
VGVASTSCSFARIREHVARVLGTDAARPLALDQGLREQGLDSLMAVELRNRLQADIGRALPSTLAFDHPSIGALATFLYAELMPAPEAGPAPAEAGPAASTVASAELEALSEEQAEALLLEELATEELR